MWVGKRCCTKQQIAGETRLAGAHRRGNRRAQTKTLITGPAPFAIHGAKQPQNGGRARQGKCLGQESCWEPKTRAQTANCAAAQRAGGPTARGLGVGPRARPFPLGLVAAAAGSDSLRRVPAARLNGRGPSRQQACTQPGSETAPGRADVDPGHAAAPAAPGRARALLAACCLPPVAPCCAGMGAFAVGMPGAPASEHACTSCLLAARRANMPSLGPRCSQRVLVQPAMGQWACTARIQTVAIVSASYMYRC